MPGVPAGGGPGPGEDAGDVDGGGGGGSDDAQSVVTDAAPDAPPLAWVAVESITVPVNGTQVMSAMTMQSGVAYRLRASGTFVIQSESGTQGDAEWWNFASLQDGVSGVDVGLAVNDTAVNTTRTPKWGAYQSSHVYEVDWTGNGARLVAMLHDGNYGNNTGSLTLTILAWQ